MTLSLRIGSLFSGIGGFELGLERAGLGRVVWQAENNPFCQTILRRHWAEARLYDDVRNITRDTAPAVDVICGGFPCQDLSSAGKGAGLEGARSGLWREYARIVNELRPRVAIVENVASGARRWLPYVRRDLHLLGYRTRAYALSAADVGAPHLRQRVFVVADADGDSEPAGTVNAEAPNVPNASVNTWNGRPSDPSSVRVANGLPGGVHREQRLRALGNAVVPQCAEVIGRIVHEHLSAAA